MQPDPSHGTSARLKATTVYISGPDGTGTGYLVSRDRIATANHVVRSGDDQTEYLVRIGSGGVTCRAWVLRRDPTADAALLRIDPPVDAKPFPIGTGLVRNAAWESYGFPHAGRYDVASTGLPLDGLVKDIATKNNVGQPAVLLFSHMVAAGTASPLNGFSGSAVVVGGTLVGHLTKHIGDVDDLRRPRYGYIYACPIEAVVALFDFEPSWSAIRAPAASIRIAADTLDEDWAAYIDLALKALRVERTDDFVVEHAQSYRAFRRSQFTSIRPDAKDAALQVDEYLSGHRTRVAKSRSNAAKVAGQHRSQSFIADINNLLSRASKLSSEVRRSEALMPPVRPTRQKLSPFSGISDAERAQREQMLETDYQSRLSAYELSIRAYSSAKEGLQANRILLSQVEQQIRQRQIELSAFNQSLAGDLSQLEKNIEIARGQDIAQYLAELREAATHDLQYGDSSPRGFARLLISNADAASLRPWASDSFASLEAVVKDIRALLAQVVREYPIEIALDCLKRCQIVVEAQQRNRVTLGEIGSALEQLSREGLNLAISTVQDIRSLPLPPSAPPRARLLARNDYEKLVADIDAATGRIESIRNDFRSYERQNAELLRRAESELLVVRDLNAKMTSQHARVKEFLDDLSLIWVDLCAYEQAGALPRNVFDYISTVNSEVQRRYSLTIDALVKSCQGTRLLLDSAEGLIANHPSSALLRAHQELVRHLGALDQFSSDYAIAREEAIKASNGLFARIWQRFK